MARLGLLERRQPFRLAVHLVEGQRGLRDVCSCSPWVASRLSWRSSLRLTLAAQAVQGRRRSWRYHSMLVWMTAAAVERSLA